MVPLFVMEGLLKQLQDCAAKLRSGALNPSAPEFEQCTAARGVPADFPSLKAAIARLNAGHSIQVEKPEVVISTVIEVLDEIRPSTLHER